MCFDKFFYVFFLNTYFGPDQTDLGPVLARFGPYWADLENEKKNISVTDTHAAVDVSVHIGLGCADPIGVPVLSSGEMELHSKSAQTNCVVPFLL